MTGFLFVIAYIAVAGVYAAVSMARHYRREFSWKEESNNRHVVQRPDESILFFAAFWPLICSFFFRSSTLCVSWIGSFAGPSSGRGVSREGRLCCQPRVMLAKMRILLVLLLTLPFLALDGCVGDAAADEALNNEGLHDATYGGPAVFSCSHGDHFSRTFLAHRTVLDRTGHPLEQEVSGVICCGFFTCVVRVD